MLTTNKLRIQMQYQNSQLVIKFQ